MSTWFLPYQQQLKTGPSNPTVCSKRMGLFFVLLGSLLGMLTSNFLSGASGNFRSFELLFYFFSFFLFTKRYRYYILILGTSAEEPDFDLRQGAQILRSFPLMLLGKAWIHLSLNYRKIFGQTEFLVLVNQSKRKKSWIQTNYTPLGNWPCVTFYLWWRGWICR